MIIVLGISLLFVDLLYILKRPEGFKDSKKSMDKESEETEDSKDSKDSDEYPILKDTTISNKIKITPMNDSANNTVKKINEFMTNRNDSVEESGTKEKGMKGGKELREVQEESKKMKDELEKIKKSPELVKAFNTMYGLDIGEINKLMNNLSSVADAFTSS